MYGEGRWSVWEWWKWGKYLHAGVGRENVGGVGTGLAVDSGYPSYLFVA